MPDDAIPSIRNRVFLSTRPEAQAFLAERWQTRTFAMGEVIYRSGETFTHAVFPHSGVISLMSEDAAGRGVEKASIGNEGFLGFTYLLGGSDALSRTVAQVPGHASWLAMADLDEAMERFVCVREAMLRYAKALIVQLMESVSCNSLHTAEQRISGWLLLAHDRMDGGEFLLTQDALARALALRRATVSKVCSELMRMGAINYSRGVVSIDSRDLLKARSCDCYDRIVSASMPALTSRT
jgi:CRP-like cAMP-binding protein